MFLNINSYYFTNEIHKNFRVESKKKGRLSRYFVPVYQGAEKRFVDNEISEVVIYKNVDKYVFFSKIARAFRYLTKSSLLANVTYVHAHTLISDGLIAYLLHGRYKTQYIITVRNTDVNFFLKNIIFRYLGRLIIKKSSLVICISPSYSKKVRNIFPFLEADQIAVLPNGIDNFWLTHKFLKKSTKIEGDKIRLLFVGRVDQNKNIELILEFLRLNSDHRYHLSVVGENVLGLDFGELNKSLNPGNSIEYHGRISSKEELLAIYRKSDIYAMISHNESFGVSYLEALSQGLPILYTKNEGVDGYFEQNPVGRACTPHSVSSLSKGMTYILNNYEQLVHSALQEIDRFSWDNVIDEYNTILDKV